MDRLKSAQAQLWGAAKVAKSKAEAALGAAQNQERLSDFGELGTGSGDPCLHAPQTLSVLVGTWNVFGERVSGQDDLADWLLGGDAESGAPDILVLGLQELCDINPANCVLKSGGDFEREDVFDAQVLQCLSSRERYLKVRSVGMVGLYMVIFVKESLARHVHSVDADRVRTTSEGIAGKKGAVVVRFSFAGSSLCFVNVHLPSGQGAVHDRERHTALQQVMTEPFQGVNELGGSRPSKLGYKRESRYTVEGHDASFVFGDLNFRLNLGLEEAGNVEKLSPEECMALQAFDGSLSGSVDRALAHFREGHVDFPPTYKYRLGSDTLDGRRVPAWTDRIFYHGDVPLLLRYRSHMSLRNTSDHRPVSALFRVTLG